MREQRRYEDVQPKMGYVRQGLELQYVHHIARRSGLDALNNIIV